MHIFLFGERYSDFCYFVPNFPQESDSCKFPNWKGDNFCDDENNNEICPTFSQNFLETIAF